MDRDRARGDCKAETVATHRAVACRIDTVERLENELEILLGNAGAAVLDNHFNALSLHAPRVNIDFRAGWRIAHGVANDILQRTAQQLRITVDLERPAGLQSDTAAVGVRLDSNVGNDVAEQLGNIHVCGFDSLHWTLETCELQRACYELLQAVRFTANSCEVTLYTAVLMPAGKRQCQLQAGERRAQLM